MATGWFVVLSAFIFAIKASSISRVEHSVEKIDEYDFACTDSMNAMLV